MRMWHKRLVPYLSNQRLIGVHGELHKHRHNFVKHHSVTGRIYPIVHIEPDRMEETHDFVVSEMLRRGMNHNSPYTQPDVSYLPADEQYARIDYYIDVQDLVERGELVDDKDFY